MIGCQTRQSTCLKDCYKQVSTNEGPWRYVTGYIKVVFHSEKEFMQMIHDKNHWVTIHADPETDESTVSLYGPLQKAKVSDSVVKQVCEIRKCSQSILNIISMPVQQQLNGCDCGVFAVVFAIDLANGKDPAV